MRTCCGWSRALCRCAPSLKRGSGCYARAPDRGGAVRVPVRRMAGA
jgi:hypothetical protein